MRAIPDLPTHVGEGLLDIGFQGFYAENRARLARYFAMAEPALFDASSGELQQRLVVWRRKLLAAGADG